jgi:hypothetical protein
MEIQKKRMRWIGVAEAIGGALALVAMLTFIIFCWKHENMQFIISGRNAIAWGVFLIVATGLIITGVRTLVTARG